MTPQIVGFLLWITGFILGLSISYLIGKVVHAEQEEDEPSRYRDYESALVRTYGRKHE